MDTLKKCQGILSNIFSNEKLQQALHSFPQDPVINKTHALVSNENKENRIDENGNEENDSKESSEVGSDVQILEDEEIRLQIQNEEELRELREKKEEEKASVEKEHLDQRVKRLMHLLTKSQFYSEYLLKKIATYDEKVPEKRRKSKRIKRDLDEKENEGILNFYSGNKCSSDEEICLTNEKENGILINEVQPKLLEFGTLRPYQLEGYAWLKTLFENGVNGILADEMGLGKTIQVIALFCYFIMKGITGPFLVIAPLSTLPNWISEFKRFAPKIPTLLYHGNEEKRKKKRDLITKKVRIPEYNCKTCPIVITSYEVVIRDTRFLKKYFWRYLAVDEGHRLKNHKCLLVKCLSSFSSTNRVILTGTPLQNNLSELWALLNFLLPDIFDNLDVFESWFEINDMMEEGSEQKIVQQEKEKQILSTLHKILNPFLLRRVKTDVDLQIPLKKELIVYTPMTQLQLDLYKAALTKDFSAFGVQIKRTGELNVDVTEGRPKRKRKVRKDLTSLLKYESDSDDETFDNFLDKALEKEIHIEKMVKIIKNSEDNFNIRNIMMLCRKIVNHPYLLQYPLTSKGEYKIDEDLIRSCGKLQVLDQVLEELKKRNHKVLIFSQMTKLLDIIEDYLYLRPQYKYKRLDGRVKLEDRQVDIDEFNNGNDYYIYLLSTRAGGLGINLTSADTVIIYDSDWNPQQDLQAQDRCHRIGQTKPVLILRLVTASTVDQEMVERATAKRKLEKMVMKKGAFISLRKIDENIDPEELLKLLQSRDSNRIYRASTGSGIFTKEELDQLLDRSELMRDDGESSSVMKEVKGIFKTITNVMK
ncbi:UNVERIFIED_CONTAM: hypothetical protein RMT77_006852 [Armadillidium vulgare]